MLNWLDRAVAYVSPQAGARRAAAREAFSRSAARADALQAGWAKAVDILRGYDSAKGGRRTAGWTAGGSSANTEVTASLSTVRNRSRELVRNNPYAIRAINVLAAKSIGTGIRARAEKGAQKAWAEFVDTCDYENDLDLYGLQSLTARASFESGEAIIRRVRTREGRVPLKLQVLEPDYLDSTRYGPTTNGNYVIAGVEVDRGGRKVAFWLYDQHPGDTLMLRAPVSRRVDASEVILFGEKLRPGQLRFMPRLAASMMRLRDHDDYRDALLVKKKIEACFAVFVIGGNPNIPLGDAANAAVTQADGTSGTQRQETLEPGMVEYLSGGQDVKFASPTTGSDDGFSVEELHAIAAGAGVTYEQLTGDISRVNYSSIRSGMNDFRDLVDAWRWTYFVPMVQRRIWAWFLDAAWTAGSIRTPQYSVLWTAPKWPYVNPVDDIKAAKEEVRGGMSTLSEKIRELGYDPEEVFDEMERERSELKKKGLVVDTDAAVTEAKPAQPEPAPADPAARAREEERHQSDKAVAVALVRALGEEKKAPVVNVTIADGAVRSETRVDVPAQAAPVVHVNTPSEIGLPDVARLAEETQRTAERVAGLGGAVADGMRDLGARIDRPRRIVEDGDGNVIGSVPADDLEK